MPAASKAFCSSAMLAVLAFTLPPAAAAMVVVVTTALTVVAVRAMVVVTELVNVVAVPNVVVAAAAPVASFVAASSPPHAASVTKAMPAKAPMRIRLRIVASHRDGRQRLEDVLQLRVVPELPDEYLLRDR